MRLLLIALLVSGLAMMPFVALKRPWALRLWQRLRLFFVIYVVVLIVSTVVALVFRWDDIYG